MESNVLLYKRVTPLIIQQCIDYPNILSEIGHVLLNQLKNNIHKNFTGIYVLYKKYTPLFLNDKLTSFFIVNLESDFLNELSRSYIRENLIPLILVTINSATEESVHTNFLRLIDSGEDLHFDTIADEHIYKNNIRIIHKYISSIHQALIPCLTTENISIITSIVDFYSCLQKAVFKDALNYLDMSFSGIGYIVPYVPESWKYRILLVSYLPNAAQIIKKLQRLHGISNYLVQRYKQNNALNYYAWLEIVENMPTEWDPLGEGSLNKFRDLIYEGNLIRTEKMLNYLPQSDQNFVHTCPTTNVMLLQMFVSQMKNWKVLWFLNREWEMNEHLFKRLKYVLEVEKFEIDADDVVKLLFNPFLI